MKRFFRESGFATFFSFALVFLVAEVMVHQVRASLPVDPGKWPRIEIAQKLDRMSATVNKERNIDVVFIGSSVMAGGIDPVEFTRASGASSYNAAWAGATARTSSLWTKDVVEPLLRPKVVVIGLQSGELNDNAPKNQITYRKFLRSPGYKQFASRVTGDLERWFEGVSDFFRYRLAFRKPETFIKDKAKLEATAVRKEVGSRGRRVEQPIDYVFRDKFRRNFFANNLANLSFGGREYRAVVRLQRVLERRGVKLVLLSTPVTDDYYSIHPNPEEDRRAYRALLRRFHEETGATVIDAGDAFPTSAPFRDPVHLDVEGRSVFAAALGERWDEIAGASGAWIKVKCSERGGLSCSVAARTQQ